MISAHIVEFLKKERVSALSIPLTDGTPHTATMHFSMQEEPLALYFQTQRDSLKCKALLDAKERSAAVVVGFSEEEFVTLQMHGMIHLVTDPQALETLCKIHYKKLPAAEQYKSDGSAFLTFKPTWWRFTDFKTDPETIVES